MCLCSVTGVMGSLKDTLQSSVRDRFVACDARDIGLKTRYADRC